MSTETFREEVVDRFNQLEGQMDEGAADAEVLRGEADSLRAQLLGKLFADALRATAIDGSQIEKQVDGHVMLAGELSAAHARVLERIVRGRRLGVDQPGDDARGVMNQREQAMNQRDLPNEDLKKERRELVPKKPEQGAAEKIKRLFTIDVRLNGRPKKNQP
jgi:hypothetical protein